MKKLLGIIVLGLLLSSNAYAECIEGDCNNGYGIYTSADGDKYIGEWKDGKKNGQGTYTWISGNTWLNGNKYVGEFKDDKRNGLGTYTFANGTVDKGIWKNNQLIEPN